MPRDAEEGDGLEALGAGETDTADPRYELVQQLLAYKRFKDAAHALDRRRELFAARFPRRPARIEPRPEQQAPPELDLEDISVWDLMEAFNRLMEQVGNPARVDVVQDDTPIELHEADIFDRLQREGPMTLQAMFTGRANVSEMIGLFLATLELLRQRKITATQSEPGGDIELGIRPEDQWMVNDPTVDQGAEAVAPAARERPDPANPDLFDWPDEQTRRRYTRRMELRARGKVIIEDAELDEDLKAIEAEGEGEAEATQSPTDPAGEPA